MYVHAHCVPDAHSDMQSEGVPENVLAKHTRTAAGTLHPRRAGQPVTFAGSIRLSPAVTALLAASNVSDSVDANNSDDDTSAAEQSDGYVVDRIQAGPTSAAGSGADHAKAGAAAQNGGGASCRGSEALQCGLTELVVKHSSVTESGVRELFLPASACRQTVQLLDVSGCAGVELACLRHVPAHNALRTLRAAKCTSIRRLSLALPNDCPLQTVDLASCGSLASLRLAAARLESLSLQVSVTGIHPS
jgi:hypothetical protein